MSNSQQQDKLVHDVLETLNETKAPITISLNDIRIPNRYAVYGTAKQVQPARETLKRLIRESIEQTVKEPQMQESFLVAIYDALSIRPGLFGISIDLKRILEHFYPDVRTRLSGDPPNQVSLGSLRFLVSCETFTRRVVTLQECREYLTEANLDVLIAARLLTVFERERTAFAELSHDMLVQAICEG